MDTMWRGAMMFFILWATFSAIIRVVAVPRFRYLDSASSWGKMAWAFLVGLVPFGAFALIVNLWFWLT